MTDYCVFIRFTGETPASVNAVRQDTTTRIVQKPFFDDISARNVTAIVGQPAILNCRVKHVGDRTVSVVREIRMRREKAYSRFAYYTRAPPRSKVTATAAWYSRPSSKHASFAEFARTCIWHVYSGRTNLALDRDLSASISASNASFLLRLPFYSEAHIGTSKRVLLYYLRSFKSSVRNWR